MSRSSPGRYARARVREERLRRARVRRSGKALAITRPNPYQWNVTGTDGTVRVLYKVYGDHVDGTYLGVDDDHAHMNMPATLMWARGIWKIGRRV